MSSNGYSSYEAIASGHDGDMGAQSVNPEFSMGEQTYFVHSEDSINSSCNSNDCTNYFDMPECVTDVYLQALNGGDESNAALRQISTYYGPKEGDINFNHNLDLNPEPLPNEGCGCTGSYNGGAGAGTAVCCEEPVSCKPEKPACECKATPCCCQSDPYEKDLVNKKPDACDCCTSTYQVPFDPKTQITGSGPCEDEPPTHMKPPAKDSCACADGVYEKDLANKKADACNTCCGPDTYELIKNKDAQRYKGKGPDRSSFYTPDDSDCCQAPQSGNTCNNNFDFSQGADVGVINGPRSDFGWVDEFSETALEDEVQLKKRRALDVAHGISARQGAVVPLMSDVGEQRQIQHVQTFQLERTSRSPAAQKFGTKTAEGKEDGLFKCSIS